MYQKTSREIFKCLKAAAVFLLALVLLLPAMPETVQAADDDDVLLDVPYFNQNDYTSNFYDKNGNLVRNDKNEVVSVKSSGCGAACSAMVVNYYRGDGCVDPNVMFQRAVDRNLYYGNGLGHDEITNICSSDSVLVTWSSSIDEVINAIKDGRPVISHMGPKTFTNHGHYIVLIGYRKDSAGNEYFQVNDPNHPQYCGVEYTRSIITSETKGNGWGITVDVGVKKLTVSPAMDSTALQVKKSCNITGYVASNVKLAEVKGEIIDSTGKTIQSATVNPNASYLDLKSSDVNMNLKFGTLSEGFYTLKITGKDINNNTQYKTISFTVGNPSPDPSIVTPDPDSLLAVNNLSLDDRTITKGRSCNINGTVTSNYVIKSVKGEILDSSNKPVQTVVVYPNSKFLNLKASEVNMNLKFGNLAVGSYNLKITVTDSKKSTSYLYKFNIVNPSTDPASTLAITSLKTEKNAILVGNACNILGTVSSNYSITSIRGEFLDNTGKTVQAVTIYPNRNSVDLKSSDINMKLACGKLAAGNYTLRVTASDVKKTVSSGFSFTVQPQADPASTLAISSLKTEKNPILLGNACNVLGTITSNYNITKVVGSIINASGTTVQTVTITPNARSVDLKSTDVNMKLSLGKLSAGNYTLKVTATDAKKTVSSGYSFT
ncbi:MAG: C39 family peptidase, partial [Lachnospiraceae bacterium]|nr:C39 family peptidase [Lachnospiraceae bacterium]